MSYHLLVGIALVFRSLKEIKEFRTLGPTGPRLKGHPYCDGRGRSVLLVFCYTCFSRKYGNDYLKHLTRVYRGSAVQRARERRAAARTGHLDSLTRASPGARRGNDHVFNSSHLKGKFLLKADFWIWCSPGYALLPTSRNCTRLSWFKRN